ncbi:redoxin domain-containing protein [Beduini massiliensis]|uniref:redoxin domain-containing protein n=1 Tax=Beduini massiliensis TaxID=1585974 RepID=UPI00059A93BB|nr:cytochrome c biogenesis protein CcdA [Beduini massiliensis]
MSFQNVSFLLVFIEGLLSFLSPCVLPLLPVYMGYLSGQIDNENPHAQRKILILTLCFIIGIFSALLLLNTGLNIFSQFFKEHMTFIIRAGGILIILLGIHQLGIIKFNTLEKTFRIQVKKKNIPTYLFAFGLGFTFSFSWTPCIGPALSGILLLANSSQSFLISNLLMFVYALALTIPFLILGIFTNKALHWFSKYKRFVQYSVKIGAVILIFIGIMMFTGKANNISNYVSPIPQNESAKEDPKNPPLTFALYDQNEQLISFEDYRGKIIFLNFWATWCPPCVAELGHIQELYTQYKDSQDVVILTAILPGDRGVSKQDILAFIDENEYTMPVLFDDGTLFSYFGINSYPTTIMINKDGTPYGYAKGQLTKEMMEKLISQTLAIN